MPVRSKSDPTKRRHTHISSKHSPISKRWRDLDESEKRRTALRMASKCGGRAVTLNLSPSFEKQLKKLGRPMREVGKRMNEELNRHGIFNLPILLVLEAAKDNGRLHLHGALIPGDHSIEVIRMAMRKAVGLIAGRPGATQFHEKPIYAADGWDGYVSKQLRQTRKQLEIAIDPRLSWVSRPMTQRARAYHEDTRRLVAANANSAPVSHTG